MKRSLHFFAFLNLILTMGGCFVSGESSPSLPSSSQKVTCSDEVVTEYSQLTALCSSLKSKGHTQNCKKVASLFLSNYPSIKCTYQQGNSSKKTINSDDVRTIVKGLIRAGF